MHVANETFEQSHSRLHGSGGWHNQFAAQSDIGGTLEHTTSALCKLARLFTITYLQPYVYWSLLKSWFHVGTTVLSIFSLSTSFCVKNKSMSWNECQLFAYSMSINIAGSQAWQTKECFRSSEIRCPRSGWPGWWLWWNRWIYWQHWSSMCTFVVWSNRDSDEFFKSIIWFYLSCHWSTLVNCFSGVKVWLFTHGYCIQMCESSNQKFLSKFVADTSLIM